MVHYSEAYRQETEETYNEMLEELPTFRRKKNLLLRCQKELLERKVDLNNSISGFLHGDRITPKMHRENDIDINIVADLLRKLERKQVGYKIQDIINNYQFKYPVVTMNHKLIVWATKNGYVRVISATQQEFTQEGRKYFFNK